MTLAIAGVTAAAMINGGVPGAAGPAPEVTAAPAGPTYVYKVHAPLGKAAQDLLGRGFDVLEQREGDNLFVLGDSATGDKLKKEGFTTVIDEVLPAPQWEPRSASRNPWTRRRWRRPSTAATARSTPSTRTSTRSAPSTRR
ncbi:hypothetical protein ACQPW3_36740 [Actinosynnema sp. CA-248983]